LIPDMHAPSYGNVTAPSWANLLMSKILAWLVLSTAPLLPPSQTSQTRISESVSRLSAWKHSVLWDCRLRMVSTKPELVQFNLDNSVSTMWKEFALSSIKWTLKVFDTCPIAELRRYKWLVANVALLQQAKEPE
jgi:hypothetical protein